jgi:protein TonB
MNIHKYLLPATVAATVHVALLSLMPEGTPISPPPIVEVPLLPPIPKSVDDMVQLPPEERPTSTDPVKPLLGKPAPPALDDVPPAKLPDDAFSMPVDNRPRPIERGITELPTTIGSEVGVPEGIDISRLEIFPHGALDRTPRAKVQIPPDYPYAMKQTGASGSVLVEFDVDTSGAVVRAEAIRYTDREFVEPAVRAVRKWKFEPGRRNGKAVPFRMTVPIEFGIENN